MATLVEARPRVHTLFFELLAAQDVDYERTPPPRGMSLLLPPGTHSSLWSPWILITVDFGNLLRELPSASGTWWYVSAAHQPAPESWSPAERALVRPPLFGQVWWHGRVQAAAIPLAIRRLPPAGKVRRTPLDEVGTQDRGQYHKDVGDVAADGLWRRPAARHGYVDGVACERGELAVEGGDAGGGVR